MKKLPQDIVNEVKSREADPYALLDGLVTHLSKIGVAPHSIKDYVSCVRKWFLFNDAALRELREGDEGLVIQWTVLLSSILIGNVLVSAIIQVGRTRLLIDHVLDGKIDLILSREIVEEFQKVIAREKFKLDKSRQNELTRFVLNLGRIVKVRSKLKVVKEDPDDNIVINTAVDGKADYIVSGDKHLLALKEFKGIKIIGVNEALKLLERTG